MRTKLVILSIILGCVASAVGVATLATWLWGWVGLAGCFAAGALTVTAYMRFVRPWHSRWGATDEELSRPMPGDEILADPASTTRAISIGAAPEQVWPWLVQIGYGRAGWYSYDWIDNDGQPSASHIDPTLQNLDPGDTIEMMPGFGPKVVEVVADHHFVAGDGEGGTWCLAVYPAAGGSRLVSRWRQIWKKDNVASWFFITIADPGAFIMEQKMLRGIKRRAEGDRKLPPHADAGTPRLRAGPRSHTPSRSIAARDASRVG